MENITCNSVTLENTVKEDVILMKVDRGGVGVGGREGRNMAGLEQPVADCLCF